MEIVRFINFFFVFHQTSELFLGHLVVENYQNAFVSSNIFNLEKSVKGSSLYLVSAK